MRIEIVWLLKNKIYSKMNEVFDLNEANVDVDFKLLLRSKDLTESCREPDSFHEISWFASGFLEFNGSFSPTST
jgi:hypothetical protein